MIFVISLNPISNREGDQYRETNRIELLAYTESFVPKIGNIKAPNILPI
jgi:hypothetical protein